MLKENVILTEATASKAPETLARAAAKWFKLLHNPHVRNPEPIILDFLGEVFPAVSFKHHDPKRTTLADSPAIYAVGRIPLDAILFDKVIYRENGLVAPEWCIWASTGVREITPLNRRFHQFGESFILGEWDVITRSPPNRNEAHAYKRVNFTTIKVQETP